MPDSSRRPVGDAAPEGRLAASSRGRELTVPYSLLCCWGLLEPSSPSSYVELSKEVYLGVLDSCAGGTRGLVKGVVLSDMVT